MALLTFKVQDLGFRGLGFRVQSLGGWGLEVRHLGFMV